MRILHSEAAIREAIQAAKPTELMILSFPKNLEQEVREILAEVWGHIGYHYAMNMAKQNVAILSFIVREDEASGDAETGGDVL